jgi:hypothetical protein
MTGIPTARLVILLLVLSYSQRGFACNVCGCPVSDFGLGLVQLVPKHVLGTSYQYSHFGAAPHENALSTNQKFHSVAFSGRWHLTNRLRLITDVPYHYRSLSYGSETRSVHQTGDINISAQVSVLPEPLPCGINHSLQLGFGVKLPTGKFEFEEDPSALFFPNLQTGTGATDLQANAFYVVQNQRFGAQVSASIRRTGENKERYRYGNQAQVESKVFYRKSVRKELSMISALGFVLDGKTTDVHRGAHLETTSGYVGYGILSLELIGKKGAIACIAQPPLVNQMADASLQIHTRYAVSAYVFIHKTRKKNQTTLPPPAVIFPNVNH